jgi:hypothetical protein
MGEGIFSKIGKPPGLSNKITLNGGADGLFVFLFLSFFCPPQRWGPPTSARRGSRGMGEVASAKGGGRAIRAFCATRFQRALAAGHHNTPWAPNIPRNNSRAVCAVCDPFRQGDLTGLPGPYT